jgi:hypothetical protein
MANFQGAVYATTASGIVVNANNYTSKDDVYFSGGPHGATCGGMPISNGTYYFKVTNPNGSLLLSTDDLYTQRSFTVLNGVWSYTGGHATGPSPCGQGITIGLAPFGDTDNGGGVYKVWISTDPNFSSDVSKTDNFKVPTAGCTVDCFPPPQAAIIGEKFYDLNGNGVLDPGELGIPGWQIAISGAAVDSSNPIFTDAAGQYTFEIDQNTGLYTVTEIFPPAPVSGPKWVATTATSGTVVSDNPSNPGPNFGNVCRGLPGNALTLGYWSNKNGQTLMTGSGTGTTIKPGVVTLLSALHLVNATGASVTPFANYSKFNSWILGATSTNAAYMLSAQLATMELNVYFNPVIGVGMALVTDPVLISRLNIPANPAGDHYISINDLMVAAITELASFPYVLAGNAERPYEVALQTLLNSLNNNLDPIILGPGACAFTTPY